MEPKPESTAVTLSAHELTVSPEQVARYAGGTRYRMDSSQLRIVHTILAKAYQFVKPAFVYRVHKIAGVLEGGSVKLPDGIIFPVPTGEQDSGIKSLAFCVCTIGGRLEEMTRTLMSADDTLASLFLDSAGVAFLETLSSRAHEILQKQAQQWHLHSGCRFAPGYGGLDLSYQKQLFELVDASLVGVRLNNNGMMSPAKSLSFVNIWTNSPSPPNSRNKCASCTLISCPYRL